MFTPPKNVIRLVSSVRHSLMPSEYLSHRTLLWSLLRRESHLSEEIPMFTRMMTCKLKLGSKEKFLEAARQLPSAYKNQPGFVDLLTFIGDDHPDRALVVAVWRTKSDSTEFYRNRAPLLDLKPFLEEEQIEHYYLETSSVFEIGSGKAA